MASSSKKTAVSKKNPEKLHSNKVDKKQMSFVMGPSNLLVILLIGISFVAGYLFFKVRNLETKNNFKQTQQADNKNETINNVSLLDLSKKVGLNKSKFQNCLKKGQVAKKVKDQLKEGSKAGIKGTPGSVIYDTKTGRTKFVNGAVQFDTLKLSFDNLKANKKDPNEPIVKVQAPDKNKDHWRGSKNARYVLVEYSDFQCPFCQRFHPIVEQFLKENSNDVAWVYRHFPLSFHQKAEKSAEAAECAFNQKGDKGFWNFADLLFKYMPNVDVSF